MIEAVPHAVGMVLIETVGGFLTVMILLNDRVPQVLVVVNVSVYFPGLVKRIEGDAEVEVPLV